jgi:hypothetical protein
MENGGWIVFALGAACFILWQRTARAEQAVAQHAELVAAAQSQRAAAWAHGDAASAQRDAALAGILALERERDAALKLVRQARTQLNVLASRVALLSGDYARASDDLTRTRQQLSVATDLLARAGRDEDTPETRNCEAVHGADNVPRRRRRYRQA